MGFASGGTQWLAAKAFFDSEVNVFVKVKVQLTVNA